MNKLIIVAALALAGTAFADTHTKTAPKTGTPATTEATKTMEKTTTTTTAPATPMTETDATKKCATEKAKDMAACVKGYTQPKAM